MTIVLQHILNGIILGGIYASMAVGLSLIFGTMRLIQFAHGEVCVLGAFSALGAFSLIDSSFPGTSLWIMIPVGITTAVLIGGGVGYILERLAFRPLQAQSPILTLVVSLGLAMIVRETLGLVWPNGRNPQPFLPSLSEHVFGFHGIMISPAPLLLSLIGFAVVIFADRYVRGTETGLAAQAIAQDFEASQMVGIPVSKIQSHTFIFSSALAGLSGVMVGVAYGSVSYDLGFMLVVKAFTASVLGGLGSILGVAVGGIVLAAIEILSVTLLPNGNTYRDTIAFAVLTVLLIIRPGGLALSKEN